MKTCGKCKSVKPLSDFWADKRRPNGFMSQCKACKHLAVKAFRARNPGMDKARYWKNRDAERERHLVSSYGVTFDGYRKMLDAQNGKCAICMRPEPKGKTLDVDHCHATGVVRGLLCSTCNRMLGYAHDSTERLQRAIEYLSVPQVAAEFVAAFMEAANG